MYRSLLVLSLAACEFPLDLSGKPQCPNFAEVLDESNGEIAFTVERNHTCSKPSATPNGITYALVTGRIEDPLDACSGNSNIVLDARNLEKDELDLIPFEDVFDGVQIEDTFAPGDWVEVSYWDHGRNGSGSGREWTVLFQWDVADSAFNKDQCWEDAPPVEG